MDHLDIVGRGPAPIDELTLVVGLHGTRYPCPDLATLDRHLADLRDRLGRGSHLFPHLDEVVRADLDRLLDRRCWMTLADARQGHERVPG